MKVQITERALIARINRKLAKEDQKLLKNRSARWHSDLGDFYVVNMDRNHTKYTHVDLEAFGRELGVIADWEVLAKE